MRVLNQPNLIRILFNLAFGRKTLEKAGLLQLILFKQIPLLF